MIPAEKHLPLAIRTAVAAGQAIMEIYDSPDSDWQVERKADTSPLTLADRRAHAVIAEALMTTPWPLLSEEGAHENYEVRREWQTLWIADPLDGTKEFLKRNGEFTVNIALVHKGVPVLGVIYVPVARRIYWGSEAGAFRAAVSEDGTVSPDVEALPLSTLPEDRPFTVVASRSHLSAETEAFVEACRREHGEVILRSAGSSLKICLVAEGVADVYPRLAPTMEWDTAAGHAIALAAGREVVDAETGCPVVYNKADLLNPFFFVR